MPAKRPAQQNNAPAQQQQGGMFGGGGGMMNTIKQGIGFGVGSAIGHRVVGGVADAVTGGGGDGEEVQEEGQTQQQSYNNNQQQGPCFDPQQQLYSCLNTNNGDAQACQWFFDSLKTCQENVKYGSQSQ